MVERRRIVARVVGAAFVACAVVLGCSSFDSAVAPPTADASPPDAEAVGPPPDGSPGEDAATASFCARNKAAAFCADFEDGRPLDGGGTWYPLFLDHGSLGFGSGTSPTDGHLSTVLIATTAGVTEAKPYQAFVNRFVPLAGATGLSASADINVQSASPDVTVVVLRVMGPDSIAVQVNNAASMGIAQLAAANPDGGESFDTRLTSPFPAGWFRLRIDYDIRAGTAQVFINGSAVSAVIPVPKSTATDPGANVVVGSGTFPGASATVEVDNVLVELL